MKKILLPIIAITMTLNLIAQSDLKTKSISIFKNGQSFVIKKGNVKTSDKSYLLTDTPNALFGTLWFNSSNSKISQITSKLDSVSTTSETQAISFAQLLYANIGKQVTITTSDDKTYKGIVENFESPESPIAIIKTTTNWVSIAPSSIKNIGFDYKPATVAKLITKENKPVFDIQFDNNGTHKLEMMYLQDGLSWTPTYLLELVTETTAQIKLQAELTNNTESISNTDINLVVGVPNFKYANQPATLISFLAQIEPRYGYSSGRDFSQMLNLSNAYVDGRSASEEKSIEINDQSSATGDFYFYSIKNLTLPKNGRGSYTLFENTINIKHIYECLLSANQKNSDNYSSSYSFEPVVSDVYHTIQIENKTKNPFTTGSVMIIDQKTQRPLVEDMLKYTAINQNSSIKLTTSPDIRVKEQENVIKTQEQEKKVNGYTYTLLTIESEVTITNSKNEKIAMSLKRVLDGKIQKSTIEYNSYQLPNTDRYNLNPIDNVAFDTEVKAGQTLKFKYTYLKYVRN